MAVSFLSGEWRKIIIVHYIIDPKILQPFLPPGTELNIRQGRCYVSLLAFTFLHAKTFNIPIPFHQDMSEVNLRFYVRSIKNPEHQGVVFIKEFIHKPTISFMANRTYHEKYESVPMFYLWKNRPDKITTEYSWKSTRWNTVKIKASKKPYDLNVSSDEFFLQHQFWGFSKVSSTKTIRYAVKHPLWKVYPVQKYSIHCSFAASFGEPFRHLKYQEPASVLLAEGSPFSIYTPQPL